MVFSWGSYPPVFRTTTATTELHTHSEGLCVKPGLVTCHSRPGWGLWHFQEQRQPHRPTPLVLGHKDMSAERARTRSRPMHHKSARIHTYLLAAPIAAACTKACFCVAAYANIWPSVA